MSILKKNMLANFCGNIWRAIMQIAFVPFYIKLIGIESYGLIGIFTILQAWLAVLDMGMTPTLGREMARFTGGARDARSIRDLVRTIEIIGFSIAIVIVLGIWSASGWLAGDWLRAENLPVTVVARAITIIGVVVALRFIENIYRSAIAGMQKQVLLNIVISIMATLQGLGALAVLMWVSPTVEAFFIWQGIISVITVILFAAVLYWHFPAVKYMARFSIAALKEIRSFATGMMAITFLALLLTQIDKILLSRLLTLEAFGYYAFAGTIAGALHIFSGPITLALYPRFTELVSQRDTGALIAVYHKGAQLVTVLMGTAAIVLIVFGDIVIQQWTNDAHLTLQTAPLVAVLALGTFLNGLMWVPYQTQLAYGWTSLAIKINIFAVILIVPAIFLVTPKYGAIGAAWLWVALNTTYVTISISFFHQRFLTAEKWRWYWQDVFLPLFSGAAVALLLRFIMPFFSHTLAQLVVLFVSAGFILLAMALTAPSVRQLLMGYLPKKTVLTAHNYL